MLRAVEGADAYIRPMEQNALTEEKCRLDIAAAAIDVAGTGKRNFLLGEVLPQDRRVYLYAVPDSAAGKTGHGIGDMTAALEASDVPHAVDWDRKSETYGLRYLPDYVRLPQPLRRYTQASAKETWAEWRAAEKKMDQAVVDIAGMLNRDPDRDLDVLRGPALPAEKISPSGRKRAATGERS